MISMFFQEFNNSLVLQDPASEPVAASSPEDESQSQRLDDSEIPSLENVDTIEDPTVEELGLIEQQQPDTVDVARDPLSTVPALNIPVSKEQLLQSMKLVFSGAAFTVPHPDPEEQTALESPSQVAESSSNSGDSNKDSGTLAKPQPKNNNIVTKKKSLESLTSTLMKKALGKVVMEESTLSPPVSIPLPEKTSMKPLGAGSDTLKQGLETTEEMNGSENGHEEEKL